MDSIASEISSLCRACKNESKHMFSLFETVGNMEPSPRLDEMLMACTAVKIRLGDGLPTKICVPCIDLLRASYLFKLKCEDTDNDLREYINISSKTRLENDQKTPTELDNNLLENITNMITENSPESPESSPPPENNLQDLQNKDFVEIIDNQFLFTCRICCKVFTTFEGFRNHKRLHTGDLLKCKICPKVFTRRNHLQRHEATHKKRKVHVCKICHKTLTRYEHLKRHLITHVKEKPFSCSSCNRGFTRAEHLINHTARCKGEKVHVCDICNKGFNREDSMEVHRKLHDNKQPVLPTLEDLNNFEDHYFEIDYDDEYPKQGDTYDRDDKSDCFEPQVHITENLNQQVDLFPDDLNKNDNEGDDLPEDDFFHDDSIEVDRESHYSDSTYLNSLQEDGTLEMDNEDDKTGILKKLGDESAEDGEDKNEELVENESLTSTKREITGEDEDYEEAGEESDSADSEYKPVKMPRRTKGKRGRPRKYPKVAKPTGRPRGRPLGSGKTKKESNSELQDLSCPECNKTFTNSAIFEKHCAKHDGFKTHSCTECGRTFCRLANLKRHLMSHSGIKPHQCEMCSKKFSRRDHLFTHMKLHMRKNKFQCEICQIPFSRAVLLAKHQVAKHKVGVVMASEKKYKCDVCQKGFTTEKYREIHMRSHMGDNTYVCKTCKKSFISKSHLTEHMKFHDDHCKKFLCSECGQRFIRNDYLVIHMRRHKGEKPFKCKFCGKGFPRTTDLTVHERYHTGEKTHLCTICGRGFGRAYNLTVHMRTHTGEKPYRCTYCDAAFAQGNDLKAHIRRHTGERFHCDLCPESFLMGYLLTQHKRTVHGLNVVSHIRRLKPVNKTVKSEDGGPEEPPPVTIKLPPPTVAVNLLNAQIAQLATAQLHNHVDEKIELKYENT